jgi:isopenicillin-N N-acyltransferase-like protein
MTPLPVIEARGEPFELGRAHGAGGGELVHGVYRARMARATVHLSEAEALREAAAYLPLLERHVPELVQEVAGIAEGAALSFEQALFLQVASEIELRHASDPRVGAVAEGCSALGLVDADGAAVIAQNWDQPETSRGLQAIVRLAPAGAPSLCFFGWAGVVGYIGVSSAGVGNVNLSVYTRRRPHGVPGYFLTRKLLSLPTLDDGLAWLAEVPTGCTGSYVVGDRTGKVATLEVAETSFRCVTGSAVAHTNHFHDAEWARHDEAAEVLPDSFARLARVRRALDAADDPDAAIRAALADHDGYPTSVCRHEPGGLRTVASIAIHTGKPELRVATGNPCTEPYDVVARPPV